MKRLNDTLPGLPAWPGIYPLEPQGGYKVYARHVPYGRYIIAQWIVRLLTLGWAYVAVMAAVREEYLATMALQFTVWFAPWMIAVTVLPVPRWIGGLWFARVTSVWFLPDEITVNGKRFRTDCGVTVQFRAGRSPVSEHRYNHLQRRPSLSTNLAYELKFRRVEMVYGARSVPITSIADEERAEQFVIALQSAYQMMAHKQAGKPAPVAAPALPQDAGLPE